MANFPKTNPAKDLRKVQPTTYNQRKKMTKTMKKIKEETDSILFSEEFNGRHVTLIFEKRTGKMFIPSLSADLLHTQEGREFVGRAKGKIKRELKNI